MYERFSQSKTQVFTLDGSDGPASLISATGEHGMLLVKGDKVLWVPPGILEKSVDATSSVGTELSGSAGPSGAGGSGKLDVDQALKRLSEGSLVVSEASTFAQVTQFWVQLMAFNGTLDIAKYADQFFRVTEGTQAIMLMSTYVEALRVMANSANPPEGITQVYATALDRLGEILANRDRPVSDLQGLKGLVDQLPDDSGEPDK